MGLFGLRRFSYLLYHLSDLVRHYRTQRTVDKSKLCVCNWTCFNAADDVIHCTWYTWGQGIYRYVGYIHMVCSRMRKVFCLVGVCVCEFIKSRMIDANDG